MQNFWISELFFPEDMRSDSDDEQFIEIKIHDHCQFCNANLQIGSEEARPSNLINPCTHYSYYANVYRNRIQNVQETSIIIDPINDGCKCNKCGLWYSMAAPNQSDHSFVCYSCRKRGW